MCLQSGSGPTSPYIPVVWSREWVDSDRGLLGRGGCQCRRRGGRLHWRGSGRRCGRFDEDSAGGGRGKAGLVGGDVIDGVGRDFAGVERDVGDQCAVERMKEGRAASSPGG
jgi:hypothetical protein